MQAFINSHYKVGLSMLALLFVLSSPALAQKNLHGQVVERANGQDQPLPGATLVWLGTQAGTTTDAKGHFVLKWPKDPNLYRLVVSFVGLQTDTLDMRPHRQALEPNHDHGQTDAHDDHNSHLVITLRSNTELATVTVQGNRVDETNPIRTELITTQDLRKAACCNLSESFETQAAVDMHYTDAVSGMRQLQMLGLDGVYAQILSENIPAVRGLSARSGLYFIPGTWIKSIDVGKGAGSVVNGYESITGQINVELAKPADSERFFYNGYLSQFGRFEHNVHLAKKLNKKWSTGLLAHGSTQQFRQDGNMDGFMDIPIFTQVNALNRWQYKGQNTEAHFGVRALYDDRMGGQMDFRPGQARTRANPYGYRQSSRKVEGFGKFGILLPGQNESIGLIAHLAHHDLNGFWGLNNYLGRQQYATFNAIYQNKFGERHGLKAGVSATYDDYREHLNTSLFRRREVVAGTFAEYAYTVPTRLTAVLGLRYDRHNLAGNIFTPRLHLKWDVGPRTALRAAAGRGLRYANPIMENLGYLVSSRAYLPQGNLQPEIAWNYGLSLHHKYRLGEHAGSLTADFYRTDFVNQVVVDLDSNPNQLRVYNLAGPSYANSLQVQAEQHLTDGLTLTVAAKSYEVRQQIGDQVRDVPFIPRHRAFANLAYDLKRWRFDVTMQWYGTRRLPTAPRVAASTPAQPVDHSVHGDGRPAADGSFMLRRETAPHYFLWNAQITKVYRTWEAYLGMENIGATMQHSPIVEAANPFSQNFDAGIIWAPIMGRMLYAGVRVSIE
jgi:outer membrane receptor for ferrienterochelin and colicins